MTVIAILGAIAFVILCCFGAGEAIVGPIEDAKDFWLAVAVGAVGLIFLVGLVACFVYTVRWLQDML